MENERNQNMTKSETLSVIKTEVTPAVKESFTAWWKSKGYRTEAEAIRAFVLESTNFNGPSQDKSEKKGKENDTD